MVGTKGRDEQPEELPGAPLDLGRRSIRLPDQAEREQVEHVRRSREPKEHGVVGREWEPGLHEDQGDDPSQDDADQAAGDLADAEQSSPHVRRNRLAQDVKPRDRDQAVADAECGQRKVEAQEEQRRPLGADR